MTRELRRQVSVWGIAVAALMGSAPALADCGIWKGLVCQFQFGTCALASLGGSDPYLECVDTLSNGWCTECVLASGINPPGSPSNKTNEKAINDLWNMRQALAQQASIGAFTRTLGYNADGRIEVAALTPAHALVHAWQLAPNGDWSDFQPFGRQGSAAPVMARNQDGRLEIFVVSGGVLYHAWQLAPNSNWSDWASLGGAVTAVAVGQQQDGRLEVVATGTDGALWRIGQARPNGGRAVSWRATRRLQGKPATAWSAATSRKVQAWALSTEPAAAQSWTGWQSLGGQCTGAPAVAANRDARLEAFCIGRDGALWHAWQMQTNGGYSALATAGNQLQGTPAVARNLDGRIEVFATGQDGALWHIWQLTPSSGWSAWHSLGGTHSFDPSAATRADGRIDVFVRGVNDRAVWHITQAEANGGWGGWESLGGDATSGPRAGRNTDGALSVFAVGQDGALWANRQQELGPGAWAGWKRIGGALDPQAF